MEIAKLVLDYLKAFLCWPVAALILGILFLHNFKDAISDFFRRIVRGEAYGVRVEATSPSEQRKEAKEIEPILTETELERYISENPKQVLTDYKRVYNSYWFERGYNLIFGTQLDLLEYLIGKGSEGENYVNLTSFHNEFLKRSKTQTYQFADYLGFLRDMNFVEYVGEGADLSLRISPYGVDFLSYIKGQYPSAYKFKPF